MKNYKESINVESIAWALQNNETPRLEILIRNI